MPVLAFLSFGSSNKAAAREAKKQEVRLAGGTPGHRSRHAARPPLSHPRP